MPARQPHVLVSGHGQLPQGMAIYEQYKSITVLLEIDPETDEIKDCAFTVLTPLTNRFMSGLIVGYSLRAGIDPLLDVIRERVLLNSQKAMIKALQAAYDKYRTFKVEQAQRGR